MPFFVDFWSLLSMSIHVKKSLFLFFIFTSLSSVSMERELNLLSTDALSNNVPQQLLTVEQRMDIACLCSFEEMPHEIQNQIACDMLADFFIVPKRMLSDSRDIESIAMYGDTLATSHVFCDKDAGFFALPTKAEVKIWDIDGTLLQIIEIEEFVGSPKVSIGKDKLVVALYGEVTVFDLCTGQFSYSFNHGHNIESLMFDDNQVVIISRTRINIWNIDNGKLLHTSAKPKKGKINNFLFNLLNISPWVKISNGKAVNITLDRMVAQIWNMNTGKLQHMLEGHTDKIIRFAVDSNKVVTQSCDNVAKIWDIHTGKLLHTLMCSCHGSMVISGDRLIAKPFESSGINIWTLPADFNEPEFKTPTHALFWIKNNVLPLQANLIARAYEKVQTKEPLIIYSNTQDACIWVTFPAHVREYLMKRLKMYVTNKKPGTFFINEGAQVLNIIIDFLTMATEIKVWPLYIDDCDLPEFKNPDHALYWIKHSMKTDQADLIARVYVKSQEKEPFIIKFGTHESYTWVKIPQHVRDYVRKYLDIKHTI
jgi:WD40 repeat protein